MELVPVVLGPSGLGVGAQERQGAGAGPEAHSGRAQTFGHHGQEGRGLVLMHQQALQGVADPGSLHLAVEHDFQGLGQVRPLIHIAVAHAHVVLEHGHGGLGHHGADEALAAPGNDHVDVLVQLEQRGHGGAVGHGQHLGPFRGQARGPEGLVQQRGQGQVGVDGLGPAAQDHGVARLEAENGRVDGHVGARLVDHGDDAQGHAHAPHLEAVGPLPHGLDGAHGIGHGRHLATGRCHFVQDGGSQAQPVQTGGVQVVGPGRVEVLTVGLQDLRPAVFQQVRQGRQGLFLGRGRGLGQCAGRVLGLAADFKNLGFDLHDASLLQSTDWTGGQNRLVVLQKCRLQFRSLKKLLKSCRNRRRIGGNAPQGKTRDKAF